MGVARAAKRISRLATLNFPQLVGVEPQRLQDGRSHLLVADRSVDGFAPHVRLRNQQSHVHVIFVQSAALGNLRAAGEDHACVDLQHDVRSAGINAGIIESVAQRLQRKTFLNSQRLLISRFAERGDRADALGGSRSAERFAREFPYDLCS